MAGTIGDAFVNVHLDPKGVEQQLSGLGGGLEGRFGKMGGVAGVAMKAGIVGAVAGTAIAVGKELYAVGEQFDSMRDDIQVATGATGKDLDGLVGSAKTVATQVPTSFEKAGEAVGQLRSRTGLSGKALEGMSKQVLELSRLTGEDLGGTIEKSTRLFGDWGLQGAEASKGLDKVFRASQATGVGVSRLEELMVKFGGPMRQLGFSFDDTAALLGKFEKEGVNTELVMGSMRIALGKFAREGRKAQGYQAQLTAAQEKLTEAMKKGDESGISKAEEAVNKYAIKLDFAKRAAQGAPKAIKATFKEIRDAKDPTEATAMALEAFGARAGPDMAAAIREGRFSIDDLEKTISKGRSTIVGTGKDTADFAEQWQMLKNKVLVAIAPLAEKFFNVVGQGMAYAAKELPPLVDGLKRDLGPTLEDIGSIVDSLMPVFKVVFSYAQTTLKNFADAAEAAMQIVGGAIKIVASLLKGDWSGAWEGAKQVVEGVGKAIEAELNQLANVLDLVTTPIRKAAAAIGNAIVDGIMAPLDKVGDAARGAINKALTFGDEIVSAIESRAAAIGRAIVGAVVDPIAEVGDKVRGQINKAITFGDELLGAIENRAAAIGRAIVNAVVDWLGDIGDKVRGAINKGITFGEELLGALAGRAAAIGTRMLQAVLDALDAIGDKVRGLVLGAITFGADLLATIGGRALAIGTSIVTAIMSGLASVGDSVRAKLRGAIRFGKDLLATIYNRAVEAGNRIVDGLVAGLGGLGGAILDALKDALEWALRQFKKIPGAGFVMEHVPGLKMSDGGGFDTGAGGGGGGDFGPGARAAEAGVLGAPAPSGAGVAGPVAPFQTLRRELARRGAPELDAGAAPPVLVRVYIGDTELRGIVRTEVGYADDETARIALGGLVGVRS
jgi:TP901 family phage tail tape measure protein